MPPQLTPLVLVIPREIPTAFVPWACFAPTFWDSLGPVLLGVGDGVFTLGESSSVINLCPGLLRMLTVFFKLLGFRSGAVFKALPSDSEVGCFKTETCLMADLGEPGCLSADLGERFEFYRTICDLGDRLEFCLMIEGLFDS